MWKICKLTMLVKFKVDLQDCSKHAGSGKSHLQAVH
jgi:hypothetical protein